MTIKSFNEYFEGYKHFDDGGNADQLTLSDAKRVFNTLKTPEAIERFQKAGIVEQQEIIGGLGVDFARICSLAHRYATYVQQCRYAIIQENTEKNTAQENNQEPKQEQTAPNKLATLRKKIAHGIDETFSTHLEEKEMPFKGLEAGMAKIIEKMSVEKKIKE